MGRLPRVAQQERRHERVDGCVVDGRPTGVLHPRARHAHAGGKANMPQVSVIAYMYLSVVVFSDLSVYISLIEGKYMF